MKRACLAVALSVMLVTGAALPCQGGSKPNWKKVWKVTLAALAAANAADVHSSRGLWEANPLMRDPAGRFHTRKGIFVKTAASGGFVLLEVVLLKKSKEPRLYKPFAITNIAAAGVIAATTVRNYTLSGQ